MITDFHTHAFPDHLAQYAITSLEKKGGIKAYCEGTIEGLLHSMSKAGIARSVICSIATRPEQFDAIFNWSKTIVSEKIIPFPSLHPAGTNCPGNIKRIKEEGFKGIKMHPYYQNFYIDDASLDPLYTAISENDLLLVMHTGYDIAFPRDLRAEPNKIKRVMDRFPELKLVSTHMGAWDMWDEVEKKLLGKPIYMEISFALQYLHKEQAKRILMEHPAEYLLFGSDSPWENQQTAVNNLRSLGLEKQLEKGILEDNSHYLLDT